MNAAPDCLLVSLLEEKATIDLGVKNKGRILHGKILDIGPTLPTASGEIITPPFIKGMEVWFLSYEGDYDKAVMKDNSDLYFVKLQDVRAYA